MRHRHRAISTIVDGWCADHPRETPDRVSVASHAVSRPWRQTDAGGAIFQAIWGYSMVMVYQQAGFG
jgi:hypothetical protein